MARKKKKRKLKVKRILLTFIVLFLIIYLGYYIIKLPINNIYIKGNSFIADDEILSLVDLKDDSSFLLTSNESLVRKIKNNKYVKNVKIQKKIGNKIIINIYEYKVLCIFSNNTVILENGQVLDNIYDLTDIPLLINDISDEKVLLNFSKKFANVNSNILRQISQIEYSPVNVDKERFVLYMDDGNVVYITLTKIYKLNKYNDIVEKMDGNNGIIYLDSGNYIELIGDNQVIVAGENNESIDVSGEDDNNIDVNNMEG